MTLGPRLGQLAIILLIVSIIGTVQILVKNGIRSIPALTPQLILLTIATSLVSSCCSETNFF